MNIPDCRANDPLSWMRTIDAALSELGEHRTQDAFPARWDEINTAMAWICEELEIDQRELDQ